MTQKPTANTESPDRETVSFWTRVRRGTLLMVSAVVMYLLMTGPLLWSYSKIENESWHNFVRFAINPIMKMEAYEKREYVESLNASRDGFDDGAMCVMMDPPPADSWWLSGLRSYWRLYGSDARFTYDILSIISFYGIQ